MIGEVVYAELAAHFPTPEELESFLVATGIRLMPSQPPVLARAGQAWSGYIRQAKERDRLSGLRPHSAVVLSALGLLCGGDST